MSQQLKVILSLLTFAIITYLFFYKLTPYLDSQSGCSITHDFYTQKLKVTVKKKYIDSSDHNYEIVEYLDSNKDKQEMNLTDGLGDMFDALEVGDSIIKKENNLDYKVVSKGKISAFHYDTICRDSLEAKHIKYRYKTH